MPRWIGKLVCWITRRHKLQEPVTLMMVLGEHTCPRCGGFIPAKKGVIIPDALFQEIIKW